MLKMKGTEENSDFVEDEERKRRKIMIMLKMKGTEEIMIM